MLEALVKCGAFDFTGDSRATLFAQIEDSLKIAQREQSDAAKNQIGLFGKPPPRNCRLPGVRPSWNGAHKEKLKLEKETLGFYITAHPLDKYERELAASAR